MDPHNNPYELLGVSPESDEAEIRQRYLALVREHSPERDPSRFARIRYAYETLRDPRKRLRDLLWMPPSQSESSPQLHAALRRGLLARRLNRTALRQLADSGNDR